MKMLRSLAGGALLAALLAGCSDRTADLQLRITALQDELEKTRAEQEAASRREAPAAEPAAPSNSSEVERNYDQGIADLRRTLPDELHNGKVTALTAFQPHFDNKPYAGEFSVEATLDGRAIRAEHIPVRAGLDGKWDFPTAAQIADRLSKAGEPPARTAAEPSGSAARPPRAETAPEPVPVMPANQTVVIDWSKPHSPAGSGGQPPPRPSGAAAGAVPPAPAKSPGEPVRVMPVTRDVRIKF